MEDKTIVCRCSDVTIEEIREAINEGYHTVNELKKILRTGMGPCQGKNCSPIILRELSIMTGKPIEELDPGTYRQPVKAISIGSIEEGDGYE